MTIGLVAGLSRLARSLCALCVLAGAWSLIAVGGAHAQNPGSIVGLDADEEGEILALDPERISERDVRHVLSRVPAPRIFLFKGTFFADMESFGRFLSQMGYPEERLRDPRGGGARTFTYNVEWNGAECVDCPRIVGALAWFYEKEGMVPMLIGHSGGGVVVSRVLYGLAEADKMKTPVWNPERNAPEPRTTIRDPVTGEQRPIAGLKVPYAAMLATGTLLRPFPFFPGGVDDIPRLRTIPDSVENFTGFQIVGDVLGGMKPFQSAARPEAVRNVLLPVTTLHIGAVEMEDLARNSRARAWIDAYRPGQDSAEFADPTVDSRNIRQAADIWHSVKKHWCIEAQRLIRAQPRAAGNPPRQRGN